MLDTVSWELFEAVMGCLDESMPPSSSSTHGGAAASSASLHGEDGEGDGSNTDKCNGNVDGSSSGGSGGLNPAETSKTEDVAALSERIVLEMAEIFSPKELHVMALAHLPAYTGERSAFWLFRPNDKIERGHDE